MRDKQGDAGPALWERATVGILIVVHVGLLAWSLVGWAELMFSHVPWQRVSNPLFSARMLVLQWGLITLASCTFLAGYLSHWRHTPSAMALIYAAMAIVCAYQTFFILTSETRFRAMAIEYAEYALVLWFLFRSPSMRTRFHRYGSFMVSAVALNSPAQGGDTRTKLAEANFEWFTTR